MRITQAVVDECLDNCVENGGPMDLTADVTQICIDLGTYAQPCEGAEVEQLLPLVNNWLERRIR